MVTLDLSIGRLVACTIIILTVNYRSDHYNLFQQSQPNAHHPMSKRTRAQVTFSSTQAKFGKIFAVMARLLALCNGGSMGAETKLWTRLPAHLSKRSHSKVWRACTARHMGDFGKEVIKKGDCILMGIDCNCFCWVKFYFWQQLFRLGPRGPNGSKPKQLLPKVILNPTKTVATNVCMMNHGRSCPNQAPGRARGLSDIALVRLS